jgi:hypothetical protein
MNKDNNKESLLYLCKNNDNKCEELIKMINEIVLNKLLKNQSYINENNDIAESVINDKINELTNKLIINPDTEAQYKNYRETKMQGTSKSIEDLENNLLMNGVGQNMKQGMDEGMEHGMLSNAMDIGMNHMNMEHLPHNIPHHIPHVGGGNRRKSNKKTKCQKHKNIKKNRKTYKKSKRIRKI